MQAQNRLHLPDRGQERGRGGGHEGGRGCRQGNTALLFITVYRSRGSRNTGNLTEHSYTSREKLL